MSTAAHLKTNERPGVRAVHRGARVSATKVRVVLDLIRNKPVGEARTILQFTERGAADLVIKVLDSAVANAANNEDIPPDELYVAACYADEGPTMKRWRPRARGRATRINKRTAHITVIVGRYTPAELDERRARAESKGRVQTDAAAQRARRVARSKATGDAEQAEQVSDDDLETTTAEDTAVEQTADDAATEATVEDAEAPEASDDAGDDAAEAGADDAEGNDAAEADDAEAEDDADEEAAASTTTDAAAGDEQDDETSGKDD
ncbi:MAG: 50S ribosomal protein L22 [Microthrixaceae bacterium]